MPLGAAVAVLGSGGTAASATAERTPLTVCQSDGTQNVNALRASGVVDRGDVAIWPAAAAVARRAPVDPEWETSEAEDSALVDAVAAADATVAGEMVIQQAFRVDLDGDRQPDKLYVVAVDDDTAAIPRRFSGLLVAWGAGKPRVLAAHGGTPGLEHRISALSDLDGDGKRELVIDERWNDGYDLALWRVTPARALERVSGFGCDR